MIKKNFLFSFALSSCILNAKPSHEFAKTPSEMLKNANKTKDKIQKELEAKDELSELLKKEIADEGKRYMFTIQATLNICSEVREFRQLQNSKNSNETKEQLKKDKKFAEKFKNAIEDKEESIENMIHEYVNFFAKLKNIKDPSRIKSEVARLRKDLEERCPIYYIVIAEVIRKSELLQARSMLRAIWEEEDAQKSDSSAEKKRLASKKKEKEAPLMELPQKIK